MLRFSSLVYPITQLHFERWNENGRNIQQINISMDFMEIWSNIIQMSIGIGSTKIIFHGSETNYGS
jgi:hypothetical protein